MTECRGAAARKQEGGLFCTVAAALSPVVVMPAGQVVYELKNPFHDGTTHVLFTPQDFTAHIHVRRPSGDLRSCKSAILPICHSPACRRAFASSQAIVAWWVQWWGGPGIISGIKENMLLYQIVIWNQVAEREGFEPSMSD